jgi:hypothetical protein
MDKTGFFMKNINRENDNIPLPNVSIIGNGENTEWTEELIRGIICNPIYAGIGPYPAIVSDGQWIKCAAIQISNEGAEQFLVNLLYLLRACFAKE